MTRIPQHPSSCPLCDAVTGEEIRTADRRFIHCPQCDFIHVPEVDHLSADAEKSRYLLHQNSIDDAGYVSTFKSVLLSLETHAPRAKRVLDFGAGPSPVLVELLRSRGLDAVGYDPYFNPQTDLQCPFEAIVSVETFEHFRNPRKELELLRGLLAPGAALVVKTLFHSGIDSLEGWHYVRDRTHIAFYSAATFEWIAGAWNLRLAEHDHHSTACLVAPGLH